MSSSFAHEVLAAMAFSDLQEFIRAVDRLGELHRVAAPVDPVLEVAEITDRVTKNGGPALLFEKPKGGRMPLFINGFGSWTRTTLALNTPDPRDVGERLVEIVKTKPPKSLAEFGKATRLVKELLAFPPKTVRKGICQERVYEGKKVDLGMLPVLKCWPGDGAGGARGLRGGGKYITFPQVITRDPETGERNVGLYRMQVLDKTRTAMHWQTHKGSATHYWKAEKMGQKLDVAVALGGDPAQMYAGAAPLPDGFDEYLLAGFMRKKGVPLVKCRTIDLEVPANAEIVLEGYVSPKERALEGPFGDHTGYYSLAEQYPVFHVTAMTMRENPVYPTTIVGRPPQEDAWIGKAIERMFLPLLKMQLPELVDMNLPVEAGFNNMAIVSMRKRYPGHARKLMVSLWGLGQIMFTKFLVVVDEYVDVHNMSEVLWAWTNCCDPARDTMILDRFPADDLDHAAPVWRLGGKIGFDATKKTKEEGFERDWPDVIEMSPDVVEKVTKRWKEYGLPPELARRGAMAADMPGKDKPNRAE